MSEEKDPRWIIIRVLIVHMSRRRPGANLGIGFDIVFVLVQYCLLKILLCDDIVCQELHHSGRALFLGSFAVNDFDSSRLLYSGTKRIILLSSNAPVIS